MTEPRTFTRVEIRKVPGKPLERQRYEVENQDGYIGDVFTFHDSKVSPSRRVWFAALEGEVVGSAKTREAAARLLGPERTPPLKVKVPRKYPKPKIDERTFTIIQPVLFFDGGTMVSGPGERPKAKAERCTAAYDLLTTYGATLHVMGITAKVAKDGFICVSPLAMEKLLAVARAVPRPLRKQYLAEAGVA
jgi:hypothetical protein